MFFLYSLKFLILFWYYYLFCCFHFMNPVCYIYLWLHLSFSLRKNPSVVLWHLKTLFNNVLFFFQSPLLQCLILRDVISQQGSVKMTSYVINVSISSIWSIKKVMKPADSALLWFYFLFQPFLSFFFLPC